MGGSTTFGIKKSEKNRAKLARAVRFNKRRVDTKTRFWEKVHKTNTCWLWTAQISQYGYGRLKVDHKPLEVHRFSYELHFRKITSIEYVFHKCENKHCVNPSHLILQRVLKVLGENCRKCGSKYTITKFTQRNSDTRVRRCIPCTKDKQRKYYIRTKNEI